MTAPQFITTYPNAPLRTGHLEDMACAFCGNRDRFDIECTIASAVNDEMIEPFGDRGFLLDAYCRCHECDDEGRVEDFVIRGLDRLILDTGHLAPPTHAAPDAATPAAESAHFMP